MKLFTVFLLSILLHASTHGQTCKSDFWLAEMEFDETLIPDSNYCFHTKHNRIDVEIHKSNEDSSIAILSNDLKIVFNKEGKVIIGNSFFLDLCGNYDFLNKFLIGERVEPPVQHVKYSEMSYHVCSFDYNNGIVKEKGLSWSTNGQVKYNGELLFTNRAFTHSFSEEIGLPFLEGVEDSSGKFHSYNVEKDTVYNVEFEVKSKYYAPCSPQYVKDDITGELVLSSWQVDLGCLESSTEIFNRTFNKAEYEIWLSLVEPNIDPILELKSLHIRRETYRTIEILKVDKIFK